MGFKKGLSMLLFAVPVVFGLVPPQKRATCPDGVNSAANAECCSLFQVRDDLLNNLFDNQCGDEAHAALRLLFHDAIGFDPKAGGGGADGSIAIFNATELTFPANAGIDDVLSVVGPFLQKWEHVISPGDFIQLAGVLSLVNCPGAPKVNFAIGRPQPKAASPPDLVPNPFDSVPTILSRFGSVGISPEEVVALLASHSAAGADDVDPSIPGTPFDSTPAVFDTQFFVDVQMRGTIFTGTGGNQGEVESSIQGTLRLQSDHELARDSATSCIWQSFVNNQAKVQSEFGAALFKLSLLGQNPASLIDCSDVVPQPLPFTGSVTIPPGFTHSDVEQACATSPFPNLPIQPGPPLVVPPIPQA